MASSKRDAAIVGIHEYPSRDVEGRVSPLQIKAECAARALADAGLGWKDVDALYDAGEGAGAMSGLSLAEYFGLKPNVIDTTMVGGSSYEYPRRARQARSRGGQGARGAAQLRLDVATATPGRSARAVGAARACRRRRTTWRASRA